MNTGEQRGKQELLHALLFHSSIRHPREQRSDGQALLFAKQKDRCKQGSHYESIRACAQATGLDRHGWPLWMITGVGV